MVHLEDYSKELEKELHSILEYWMQNTPDEAFGGFIGKIDHDNRKYPEAPKGSVLNSRILWTFSAAYGLTGNDSFLTFAKRAFEYIRDHFVDKENGGVYWTVDYRGNPLDTKNQVYALAFAVYALSEYARVTDDEAAKQLAINIYQKMEAYCHDKIHGGYQEALDRRWHAIDDVRLSEKDENDPRSMNTHLHVLEAYTCLYRVHRKEELRTNLEKLIRIFLDHIISSKDHHLILFLDEQWNARSNIHSYGHDVETAWLLLEAAEVLEDEQLIRRVKETSILLAEAALEGMDDDGGLWYEMDLNKNHLVRQKHSWPQAEAMVGFFNAWQISGDVKYLQHAYRSWQFIKKHIKDPSGEWVWGIEEDGSVMNHEDKVGIWKCPYHNSRACMEVISRIQQIKHKKNYEIQATSI